MTESARWAPASRAALCDSLQSRRTQGELHDYRAAASSLGPAGCRGCAKLREYKVDRPDMGLGATTTSSKSRGHRSTDVAHSLPLQHPSDAALHAYARSRDGRPLQLNIG